MKCITSTTASFGTRWKRSTCLRRWSGNIPNHGLEFTSPEGSVRRLGVPRHVPETLGRMMQIIGWPFAPYNEIDEYAAEWLENLIRLGAIASASSIAEALKIFEEMTSDSFDSAISSLASEF